MRIWVAVGLVSAVMFESSAQAGCEAPSTNQDLVFALDEAIESYRQLEIDAFRTRADVAVTLLGCQAAFLPRGTAAAFHRVRGLRAFLDQDLDLAAGHFAGARAIQPAYTFPADLVPPGNPVMTEYHRYSTEPGNVQVVPVPSNGTIKLDGFARLNRSTGRPVIFQRADDVGRIVDTRLLFPGDALPEYEAAAPATDGRARKDGLKRGGPSVPLLVVSGIGLAAAGALYGASLASRASYDDLVQERGTTPKQLDGARGRTNGLLVGAGVAGVVAVGAGTASFVVSGSF